MKTILTVICFASFFAASFAQTVTKEFRVYFSYNSSIIEQEIPAEITPANVISIIGYASEEGTNERNNQLSYDRAIAVADNVGFDVMLNLRHVSGGGATQAHGTRKKNRVVVITYEVPETSKMSEFDCELRQKPSTKREQRFEEARDAKLAEIRAKDTISDIYINTSGDTVNLDGTIHRSMADTARINDLVAAKEALFNCPPIIATVVLNRVDTFVKVDTITKTVTIMQHADVVRFLMKERNMTRKEAYKHIDDMTRLGQTYDMETLKPLEKADSFKDLKKRVTKRKVAHKVTKRRPRATKGKSAKGGILNWIAPNRHC